ncbi:MAG TPA: serine hydrolase domain-containing protein [Salinivirgaceae bacterium]|nr:serine hydrolase domain-containing protein [Salinivirgaceae bacterium]
MKKGKTELIFLIATAFIFYNLGATQFRPQQEGKKIVEPTIEYLDTSFYPFLRGNLEQMWNTMIQNGFSGVILVSHYNNIIFEQYHTRKHKYITDTVFPNSRFQIASVSKQFTAVAILQLYERGLINLDDTIQKFIPEFPYKNITIHSLLCHRSGLPNYIYYLSARTTDHNLPVPPDTLLSMWTKHPPAIYFQPGHRFKYSNTGYVILSMIVERVSGLPFEEYLRKNIFEPLQMNETDVYIAGRNDSIPNAITGYSKYWKDAKEDYLNGVYGDKGIWTTARDLLKWDQALYDSIVISPSTLQLAFLPHGRVQARISNYGYGWRILNSATYPVFYHTGWWQGFKSLLVHFSQHRITVVVLKHTIHGQIPTVNDFYQALNKSFLPNNLDLKISRDAVQDSLVEEDDDDNNESI